MGLIKPVLAERDNINGILNAYRKRLNAPIEQKCMEFREEEYREKQSEKKMLV